MKKFAIFLQGTVYFLASCSVLADGNHHNNTFLGGRAATFGRAYTAISDDPTGAYYNPAGIVYAQGDSVSGSANVLEMNSMTYKSAIGGKDWKRDSEELVPNNFGLLKKFGDHAFTFNYFLTDYVNEDQNQVYTSLSSLTNPIDYYNLDLHVEDSTYLIGGSYAYRLIDTLALGLSVSYHFRSFRKYQTQHIEYTDTEDETSTLDVVKKEKGVRLGVGGMWSPIEKLSVGLNVNQTFLLTSINNQYQTSRAKGTNNASYLVASNTRDRKLPLNINLGFAYFYSPYLLTSLDINYYLHNEAGKENVFNLSLGHEHFLDEKHALRFGVFSNHSNSKKPTSATVAPMEKIDLYGVTLGYSYYTPSQTLTFGVRYSQGKGDVQIYDGSSTITKLEQRKIGFILSSDIGL